MNDDGQAYFYSTQGKNSFKVYKILVSASLQNAEKKAQKKLKLIDYNSLCDKPKYSISPVWLVLRSIGSLSIFGKNALSITYRGYSVGRYSLPTAYRDPSTYINFLKYHLLLLKIIYQNCKRVDAILSKIKSIRAGFVDHGFYSNGLLYEIFSEHGIPIYNDSYPYNLSVWCPGRRMAFEDSIFIPKKSDVKLMASGKNFLAEITKNSKKIPYMVSDFDPMRSSIDSIDYIIYAHSFTDAQLNYGYDGAFLNVYDWLIFTLDYLLEKNKRVCLKAHPNFYVLDDLSDVSRWDKKIFEKIKKKYATKDKLTIIDYPLQNPELLRHTDRSTVLVSHHGNALLEGAAMGFKCISSTAASWRYYNLFNSWTTKVDYIKLLSAESSNLVPTNLDDLYMFCGLLYDEKTTIFGEHNVGRILSMLVGKSLNDFIKSPLVVEEMSDELMALATSRVYDAIHEIPC